MKTESLRRYVWWSLRRRFYVALSIVSGHALVLVIAFGSLGGGTPQDWEMTPEDRAGLESVIGSSYQDFLRQTWSGDLAILLAFVGVVLAVGGIAADRREGALDFTLALPVERARWSMSRFVVVLTLLLALAFLSAVLIAVGGYVLRADVPHSVLLVTVLIGGIGPAYGVAAAILMTSWTRDHIVAAVAASLLIYLTTSGTDSGLTAWMPGVLLDIETWRRAVPWRSVLSTVALTVAFLGVAARNLETMDV